MKPAALIRWLFRPVTVLHLAVLFALLETLTYLVAFGPLASLNVLLLAAALGMLAHDIIAGRIRIALRPEYVALLVFFIAITLSRRHSINAIMSGAVYRRIISDFACFILAALMLRDLKAVRGFLMVLLVSVLFLSIDLVIQSVAAEGFRVAKAGWDGNEYGVMCVALVPPCFALLRISSSRLVKALSAAAVILVGMVVILTASRTAMLLYGIALAMLTRWKQIRIQTLVAAVFVGALALPLLPQKNLNRLMVLPGMQNTVDKTEDPFAEKSYELRVEVWKHALTEVVPTHLFFGTGLGNWNYYSLGGVSAHNMYLSVLGEHGIAGLFFFLTIIVSSASHYRRAVRLAAHHGAVASELISRNLSLSLLLLLLGGCTLTIEFRLKLLWLLLGLPLGLKHVIESEGSL